MKSYVTLDEIGLSEKSGVLGKIRKLIIQDVVCKKIYKEIKQDIKYKNSNTKLNASYANYPSTYKIKVVDKYLYQKEKLLKWFEANQTITFKRKEINIKEYYDYEILTNIDT